MRLGRGASAGAGSDPAHDADGEERCRRQGAVLGGARRRVARRVAAWAAWAAWAARATRPVARARSPRSPARRRLRGRPVHGGGHRGHVHAELRPAAGSGLPGRHPPRHPHARRLVPREDFSIGALYPSGGSHPRASSATRRRSGPATSTRTSRRSPGRSAGLNLARELRQPVERHDQGQPPDRRQPAVPLFGPRSSSTRWSPRASPAGTSPCPRGPGTTSGPGPPCTGAVTARSRCTRTRATPTATRAARTQRPRSPGTRPRKPAVDRLRAVT